MLRRKNYELPAPVGPLTLALVADLHDCDPAPVLESLRRAAPDVICLAGDFFEGPPRRRAFAYSNALTFFAACGRIAPTFYTPGNHDMTVPDPVRDCLGEAGITLLENEYVQRGELSIGGLCSAYYREDPTPDMDFLRRFAAAPGYRVLLSHHPEYYRRYLRPAGLAEAFDLILSGHNHGGQWALGSHGLYVPGQGLLPPHCAGVFDGRLVVSRGVANNVWVPRIGNPTELVTVCLRPESE